ncbi:MAG: hypothetical protein ACHQUC_03735 [Chlamydiales bacterium]
MFKLFFSLLFLFGGICHAENIFPASSVFIINSKNESGIPRNFRSTSNDFMRPTEGPRPSTEGLKALNISGSSQFSEKGLVSILDQLGHPKNFYIVDLRQEYHGFLNGTPVSWYAPKNWENVGKSVNQILNGEKERLQVALERKDLILSKIVKKDKKGLKLPEAASVPFTAVGATTEEVLASRYQLGYIRIPVTDACKPTNEMVDRFISFVKSLPNESWLHFHCSAGVGRTSTFMIMYDIMKNSKKLSFEEIFKRQYLLGGANLSKFDPETSWKYPLAVERYQFLKDFYEYARANSDNFATTWSASIHARASVPVS